MKAAVWGISTDKTPGPDGLTFSFIRHFWEVVGADFTAAVKYYENGSSFEYGGNDSFIALIPKVKDLLGLF